MILITRRIPWSSLFYHLNLMWVLGGFLTSTLLGALTNLGTKYGVPQVSYVSTAVESVATYMNSETRHIINMVFRTLGTDGFEMCVLGSIYRTTKSLFSRPNKCNEYEEMAKEIFLLSYHLRKRDTNLN